ncbi:PREDICTED: cell death regulator Aven [Dipodomys ordii]|uniref:Cell death regulator Aven n=1 Tax=Dipodomys ordii TaxID=10020 RepID=A0A1S3F1W0_DIPOR|nr:PREDICTED: cell death regulator Aven [Dipodomys ordii]
MGDALHVLTAFEIRPPVSSAPSVQRPQRPPAPSVQRPPVSSVRSVPSPPGMRCPVEDGSDSDTYREENDEQGNYSKRKVVSNWDRYQNTEEELNTDGGESQRGTDFSVLLSSAGDSFSQFRFVEEKEWEGDTSCPKQNSALYVDSESLVRALQELPLSLRLNVAAELVQATVPLELPQVKPKRKDDGKGAGMQLRGSLSELRASAAGGPRPRPQGNDGPQLGPSGASQPAAGCLEEELDLLLSLDAPVSAGGSIPPGQTSQDLRSEEGEEARKETEPSVTGEKNADSEQAATPRNVTEEELEDWLDSMIS